MSLGHDIFSIASTLALSTSIPLSEILWPKTIPSLTIKWHFSQFKTRFVCLHLCKTQSRLLKRSSKDFPYTEKSSIKTSTIFSQKLENIAVIHLSKVAVALHKPEG